MSMDDQVWITGLGAVTPLGNDLRTFADNLLAGRSGVRANELTGLATSLHACTASVGVIPPPRDWSPLDFTARNRLEQLSLTCTVKSLDDAGVWDRRESLRVGLVLGMGAEYLRVWELDILAGGRRVYEPAQDSQSIVHRIHSDLGLRGPAVAVAAACASSGFSFSLAREWIQSGLVDVCLAGGCDLITPMAYAGFFNLRALSRYAGDPVKASRPFDRDRDGFVMGEGGVVFVMESARHARRRGARAYAELAGFGSTSDAAHMVIPSTDPQPASHAIERALADADVDPGDVDYVNAHAAGTPVGDRAESRAILLALGAAAAHVPVSSSKSMTGHLLSAAAAVEILACLAALERQAVPPTINLDHPDAECSVRHVPNEAQAQRVRVTASNSFGFGGSNVCLVLRAA
ncbi:MAG: beta-ketoacyl-[acyl-carrier-protein] synthase family protein [Pirellulaceae bacterium]|jgi:3-oxoacyl-[acyl-carrier-protein] synthase II|nr:beta-ketoacyl-[acyl-carrier-protein] synthase family protein [Pirellulaceae bacterium]